MESYQVASSLLRHCSSICCVLLYSLCPVFDGSIAAAFSRIVLSSPPGLPGGVQLFWAQYIHISERTCYSILWPQTWVQRSEDCSQRRLKKGNLRFEGDFGKLGCRICCEHNTAWNLAVVYWTGILNMGTGESLERDQNVKANKEHALVLIFE